MPKSEEADFRCIAKEIEEYLNDHPKAADTLEGITEWWLLRKGFETSAVSIVMVHQALEYLVSTSIVEIRTNLSGKKVYSSKKTEN